MMTPHELPREIFFGAFFLSAAYKLAAYLRLLNIDNFTTFQCCMASTVKRKKAS
jgi:hypothetical protein